MRALAVHLRREQSEQIPSFAARDPVLYGIYQEERRSEGLREIEYEGRTYLGRGVARDDSGASILFGVASERLESLLVMTPIESPREIDSLDQPERASKFDDDSLVLITLRE